MKTILNALNSVVGVKGSMVVTPEGIIVASDLRGALDEESVAAVGSRFLRVAQEQAGKVGVKGVSRFVLEGTHGKIVFVPAGKAFLVVIADMNLEIDASFIEILSAARRIEARLRLGHSFAAPKGADLAKT